MPLVYDSKVSKLPLYYLEALIKEKGTIFDGSLTGTKVSYVKVGQGEMKAVDFCDVSLEQPVWVVVENKGEEHKTLFGGRVWLRSVNEPYLSGLSTEISKLLDLAKEAGHDLVINLNLPRHSLSLKFSQDNENPGRWRVYVHNSDYDKARSDQAIGELKILFDAVGSISKDWTIDSLSGVVIPNYSHPNMPDGICGPISDVMSAVLFLGNEKTLQLKDRCRQLGSKCLDVINEELHPIIDEMIKGELSAIKDRSVSPVSLKPVSTARLKTTLEREL